MTWIFIAILAYLLNAISFVVDKYILVSIIPRPFAYAFWVSILSVVAVVLIPFGVHVPSPTNLLISLFSGSAFFAGLLFFYHAIRRGDVSVSSTATGVFTIFFSYIFSVLILHDYAGSINTFAALFLLSGTILLGFEGRRILIYVIPAGVSFALSLVLLKLLFNDIGFINGLFWTRIGFVIAAILPIMLFRTARREIFASLHETRPSSRTVVVLNKMLVGAGFLLLYWAIQQGNVLIVNALLGVQFSFILILSLITERYIPAMRHEKKQILSVQKVGGILLSVTGFFLFLISQ